MLGIDFLKEWDIKKHGLTGLVVAIGFVSYELFTPKDPSCTQEVKFLQTELSAAYKMVRDRDEVITEKDLKYKKIDSAYREKVIKPAKIIIKNQHYDQ